MESFTKKIFILLISLGSSFAYGEEALRDYYSEPGLHPYKETLNQGFNEFIDPFGGGLQIKNIDWVLPGNGGMNIVIQRTYTLPQNNNYDKTYTGVGWSLHFGKLIVPEFSQLCNQNFDELISNNPALELPDGSREVFYRSNRTDAYMISANRWKAECIMQTNPAGGMIVTSPTGMKYTLDTRLENTFNPSTVTFYVSKIEDLYNNYLTFNYDLVTQAAAYIRDISSSDGRVVNFEYSTDNGDTNSDRKRLLYVKYNNVNRVQYVYKKFSNSISETRYLLRSVLTVNADSVCWYLADNRDSDCLFGWQYEYSSFVDSYFGEDPMLLSKVTYPDKGVIDYTYEEQQFGNANVFTGKIKTIVTKTKIQSGPNIQSARWVFTYIPSASFGVNDRTRVDIFVPASGSLDRSYEYTHVGLTTVTADFKTVVA